MIMFESQWIKFYGPQRKKRKCRSFTVAKYRKKIFCLPSKHHDNDIMVFFSIHDQQNGNFLQGMSK